MIANTCMSIRDPGTQPRIDARPRPVDARVMLRRTSSSAAEELLTVRDFERAARRVLTKQAYDYYRSGADGERTLRENARAFERWELRPRMLVDVAERDLSIDLLGERLAQPVVRPCRDAEDDAQCAGRPEAGDPPGAGLHSILALGRQSEEGTEDGRQAGNDAADHLGDRQAEQDADENA